MTEDEKAQQLARAEAYRKFSVVALVMLVTAALGLYASWLYSTKLADAVKQTARWFELSRSQWLAHLLVVGPFLVLLVVVIALLVRHGLPKFWESARRSAFLGMLLGACVVAVALLTSDVLTALARQNWLYFIPVVPPLLLGYQGLAVWRQRPRSLGAFTLAVSAEAQKALEHDGAIERFKATHRQLLRVFGAHPGAAAQQPNAAPTAEPGAEQPAIPSPSGDAYGPSYFFTNFAVPALLLLAVGFGAIAMALNEQAWGNDNVVLGLRWGVVGAFVYVLIEFGSRSFRSDLTVGAVIWAIITLIVGPALAVLLAVA